jgi:hypothetical protein
MNLEQIKHLPDGDKERFRKLESVFNSPGWELVMDWAKTRRADVQNRQLSAGSWDHALLNRGAGYAYAELENLRELTEAEYAAIAQHNAELVLQEDEAEYE